MNNTVVGQQKPFVTEWNLIFGTTIAILVNEKETYDYHIVCKRVEDDVEVFRMEGVTGNLWIENLESRKNYRVYISGVFPQMYFNFKEGGEITKIIQWGDIVWLSFDHAFAGCNRLSMEAKDVPDLSNVTDMQFAFADCFQNRDAEANWNWDVSKVENMKNLFARNYYFNGEIMDWDVGAVKNMRGMFSANYAFNQDLSGWNVSNVQDMSLMFAATKSYNQPLNVWEVSNVENMNRMFNDAQAFNQVLDQWDVHKVADMSYMFEKARLFNTSLGAWQLHHRVNMEHMLDFSGLDCDTYSNTLSGWANQSLIPENITLGVQNLYHDNIQEIQNAKTILLNNGWEIIGDEARSCLVHTDDDNQPILDISPNPAFNAITISGITALSTIQILDVTGKVVYQSSTSDFSLTIPLEEYDAGVYFVQVVSITGFNSTKKLVKI
ncbi:MAG: BspA family leucine-rich repeat surface protein [Chitinophagales bacterium]|nr:BspA family leucine-rich repeat surface protein [Chitinophagales bacterium]